MRLNLEACIRYHFALRALCLCERIWFSFSSFLPAIRQVASLEDGGNRKKENAAPARHRRPFSTKTEERPSCWAKTPERIGPKVIPMAKVTRR